MVVVSFLAAWIIDLKSCVLDNRGRGSKKIKVHVFTSLAGTVLVTSRWEVSYRMQFLLIHLASSKVVPVFLLCGSSATKDFLW